MRNQTDDQTPAPKPVMAQYHKLTREADFQMQRLREEQVGVLSADLYRAAPAIQAD